MLDNGRSIIPDKTLWTLIFHYRSPCALHLRGTTKTFRVDQLGCLGRSSNHVASAPPASVPLLPSFGYPRSAMTGLTEGYKRPELMQMQNEVDAAAVLLTFGTERTRRAGRTMEQSKLRPSQLSDGRNRIPVNILTLKWGDRYGAFFVNRMYHSVRTNLTLPFRFFCFTDNPSGLIPEIETRPLPNIELPDCYARTTWLKLGLFEDNQAGLTGDCLFMDLDMVVVGNMDCFFEYMPGKRCIIHNWVQRHLLFKKRPEVGNSSIFRWRANTMQFAIDKFYSEQAWALTKFKPPQTYLTYALGEKYWWPETWVKSFKRHAIPAFPLNLAIMPKIPQDTRIMVFHGRPDQDQAMHGYNPKKLHRRTRPAPWIADYWNDPTDQRTDD